MTIANAIIIIEISDVKVTMEGDRVISVFNQNYFCDRFSDAGKKKLTWVKKGPNFLIAAEEFEDHTPAARVSIAQVKEQILGWRKAWEELAIKHELGTLPNYYDPEFKSAAGSSLEAYLNKKLAVAKKSAIIAIDISNINASVLGDRAIASFNQSFRSESYADEGTKILMFKVINGKPVITMEGFHLKKTLQSLDVDDFWGD